MIDDQITRALLPFWLDQFPQMRMPRSFDRRINPLVDTVKPLYAPEPAEYRTFMWFIHRIKDANGQRDNIAPGLPGKVERRGGKFRGLQEPYPRSQERHGGKECAINGM